MLFVSRCHNSTVVTQSVMRLLSDPWGIPVVDFHDRELLDGPQIPVLVQAFASRGSQLIAKADSHRSDGMTYDR